jgi:hypothetical protein
MATNDDLDDFFKKKDRKGKKQTGLLTNNEELHKQLVIVTSATSAFKEIMDFDDEEDGQPINNEILVGTGFTEDIHKHVTQHNKTKIPDTNKHLNDQQINISSDGIPQLSQQDEWEEFEDSNSNYKQLLLKFSGGNNNNNDDDNEDEYYDDEINPNNNDDNKDINGDREQTKDKPVWKTNQVKQQEIEIVVPIVEEPKPSTTSTGVYRPPQMRSGLSVTVVSGGNQRVSKKKEPNLASTDEFPTLGATVNKK